MTRYKLMEKHDFECLYLFYYPKLVRFSQGYVLSKEDAENIVQDVFLIIWEQRHSLSHLQNPNAYLFKLVKNKCIDFLRHKIMTAEKKQTLQDDCMREYGYNLFAMEQFDENNLAEADIDRLIHESIQSLPEKCREIFILSRFEGMTHQKIADKYRISPSTVNNQITLAMKKLKEKLKDILSLIFI
jgi:RNA polymerase sigma-70 factor (ECF subfamily)